MNTTIKRSLLSWGMVVGSGFLIGFHATAQTFTVVHTFSGNAVNSSINSDGIYPMASLVASGARLYGTAQYGGSAGAGTAFAVNTDGTGFSVLHNFVPQSPTYASSPTSGFVLSSGVLYGTAPAPSASGGIVYRLNTNGSGFSILKSFNGTTEGGELSGGLILLGNTLFGMTYQGSISGIPTGGTVYSLSTSGSGFAVLLTFDAYGSSGRNPYAGFVASGNTLYGTCSGGGGDGIMSPGGGTVFKINTDGSLFTILHSFSETGSQIFYPACTLVLSGNTLFGTTVYGGSSGNGTVFKLNTDGSGFTILHSFSALVSGTNSDGASPQAGLLLSGNTLYGATAGGYGAASGGGSAGNGTVFALNTDGTGFRTLYNFSAWKTNASGAYTNSDGGLPAAGLILSSNVLYGTASKGGLYGNGTIFSITLPVVQPQLTITPAGTNVVLTWPPTPVGFTLESTTDLDLPVIWSTTFPAPVLVNGQNTVTNPISAAQQFYRLSQ